MAREADEAYRAHREAARLMQRIAIAKFKSLVQGDGDDGPVTIDGLSIRDALKLLVEGAHLERLSLGLPGETFGIQGMTDEQLEREYTQLLASLGLDTEGVGEEGTTPSTGGEPVVPPVPKDVLQ